MFRNRKKVLLKPSTVFLECNSLSTMNEIYSSHRPIVKKEISVIKGIGPETIDKLPYSTYNDVRMSIE